MDPLGAATMTGDSRLTSLLKKVKNIKQHELLGRKVGNQYETSISGDIKHATKPPAWPNIHILIIDREYQNKEHSDNTES